MVRKREFEIKKDIWRITEVVQALINIFKSLINQEFKNPFLTFRPKWKK